MKRLIVLLTLAWLVSPAFGEWSIETLDTPSFDYFRYTSIKVDEGCLKPHIAYQDFNDGGDDQLKYIREFCNGDWGLPEVLQSGTNTGAYPSLDLDNIGSPIIAYSYAGAWTGRLATYDGDNWSFRNFESDSVFMKSLDIDGLNLPHVVYNDDGHLHYAWYDEQWERHALGIHTAPPATSSISFELVGLQGYVAFLTIHPDNNTIFKLKYTTGSEYDWEESQILDTYDRMEFGGTEANVSMVIDNNDNPHIIYFYPPTDNLKYAYFDGTEWHMEAIEVGNNMGRYNSLDIDDYGNLHVSCVATDGSLAYLFYDGTEWYVNHIEKTITAQFTSIDVDYTGTVHISYIEGDTDVLKYAHGVYTSIPIPTLTEWGTIIFMTVIMGVGVVILRKRTMA